MNTLDKSWEEKAEKEAKLDYIGSSLPTEAIRSLRGMSSANYLIGASDYMAAVENMLKNKAKSNIGEGEHLNLTKLVSIADILKELQTLKPLEK